MIRVTVEDTEAGTSEVKEMVDDVIFVTAGNHYVDSMQRYANGTQVWTIKVDEA